MHIQLAMEFEWDEGKRRANYAKHGLDFRDAATWILREVRVSDRGEGARGVRGMPGQEVVTEGGRQRRCSKPSHCGRTGCFCHGESGALFRSWPVATIASLICEIAT